MKFIVIDLESFFTDEKDSQGRPYRFKQRGDSGMNTEEYVRHPWFELHGADLHPLVIANGRDRRER